MGWNADTSGIAIGYVDPVARIQAQDEAVYGSTSITMEMEAIATTILARNEDEIAAAIQHHPEADFFINREFRLSSKVIQGP